jgi:hypothetical protein
VCREVDFEGGVENGTENEVTNIEAVKAIAEKLYNENDETALEVLIAKCDAAVKENPELGNDPNLDVKYTETTMSFETLKIIGRNILNVWNEKIYGLVCGTTKEDQRDRKIILDALKISSGAAVGAIAATLTTTFALPAALSVAVAALIVKRFIWPARAELCKGWKEKINAYE